MNVNLNVIVNVIGIFPNADSLLRLIGSVLMEQNEILMTRKAVFSPDKLDQLCTPEVRDKLLKIALEQRKLLAA